MRLGEFRGRGGGYIYKEITMGLVYVEIIM